MSLTAADLSAFTQDFPDTLPLPKDENERVVEVLNHLRTGYADHRTADDRHRPRGHAPAATELTQP